MSRLDDQWIEIVEAIPERWRPIPGFTCYEISDHGRVRSWRDWPGRRCKLPMMLRGQIRAGQHRVYLGREMRYIDDLMNDIWGGSKIVRLPPPPPVFRRVMLTQRQHDTMIRVLELIDSPVVRGLMVAVRQAKRVRFYDPLDSDNLVDEGDPACEG